MSAKKAMSRRDFLKASASAAASISALVPLAHIATAAPAAQEVTLEVWHTDETELLPIIDAFKAANPNVSINYTFFPWGPFFENLETAYAAGTPPDVHRQDDDEIPFFVQRGVLLPLTDAIGALDQGALFWDAVASTMINGDLWVSTPAMRVDNLMINKTLFQEAGVPLPPVAYPSDDWTWDDFTAAARSLTEYLRAQGNELGYGFIGANSADFITSMGRSRGGQIISEDCLTFMMHETPMTQAMQDAVNMILVDKTAVDPETAEVFGGGKEMFSQGLVGMWYVQTRDVPNEDVTFEWDVAGVPVFPGQEPVHFAAIEAYGVPAVTAHPAEAASFAAFLMGEESQLILAETKNVIPVNRAAAIDIWAAPDKTPASRKVLVDSLAYARTLPFAVGFGRVQDVMNPLIQEVALGQKTAQAAMDEAKPLADEILAEAGGCLGDSM